MFTQLNPPLPLDTSKGRGYAVGVIDYGLEHSLIWVTALNDSGELWCIPNSNARVTANWTAGRAPTAPPAPPEPPSDTFEGEAESARNAAFVEWLNACREMVKRAKQ